MNIGNSITVAKTFVTSKAGRQILKTQKNSPAILFGVGVVGFVATTVLASKATLQLEDILEEHEDIKNKAADMLASKNDKYTAKDYTQDMTKLKARLVMDLTKLYAPPVIVGVVSICALGGSHVIMSRRNAGLMAAYAALDKGFNEYRSRVRELIGDDKERELRYDTEKTLKVDTETGDVKEITTASGTGASPYARFFSKDTSNAWSPEPEYNLFFLRSAQMFANDRLKAKGHVFLNEIFDDLGLERTKAGAVTGWVKNNPRGGDGYIDFGIFDGDKRDQMHDFVTGREDVILLDFNVDGIVHDLL